MLNFAHHIADWSIFHRIKVFFSLLTSVKAHYYRFVHYLHFINPGSNADSSYGLQFLTFLSGSDFFYFFE